MKTKKRRVRRCAIGNRRSACADAKMLPQIRCLRWAVYSADAHFGSQKRGRRCANMSAEAKTGQNIMGSNLVISSFSFGIFGARFLGDFEEFSSCRTSFGSMDIGLRC
uniref:Uncharacterized protein n=1 Tax=Nicotiana tabacum TaxID=4097 RepID=A0A1S3Y1M1_TOBAC|nr:PREDICTED: uncharacterized protein LOC107771180 [Nicotiana tabacum]